jgi:mandelate racemase
MERNRGAMLPLWMHSGELSYALCADPCSQELHTRMSRMPSSTSTASPSIEISGITIRQALPPLRRPLATRVGYFEYAPFLLIDLHTRGGGTGHLLGFTFTQLGGRLVKDVLEHLAALTRGSTIAFQSIAANHDSWQKSLSLLGHEGIAQMALSMFDMVVHDALAREAGVPLYRLLGGKSASMPAYNSTGLGLMPADAAGGQAAELMAENGGYRHIKMRLGRDTVAEDVAAVAAVREAVGPDAIVSCDFNQGLPSATALQTCKAIDGLGLAWIEEPIVYDDFETCQRLTRKLATPIQLGENFWGWRTAKHAIDTHACDYVMPDILRIGGVTGWMRMAALCEVSSVPFSSHLSPEFSAHTLAATPTCHWLEYMDWGQDLLRDPLVPDRGYARPCETPGAGLEWNEAEVEKHVVS